MQLLFQTLPQSTFPFIQKWSSAWWQHRYTHRHPAIWQQMAEYKARKKNCISHATIRINSATHPWKSVNARKNFWHTENWMWKQGLAGRLWDSAAAVVNSMPIYCQIKKKKKKKKRRRASFWSLTYCGKCMPFCFSQGEQLHNAITLD